MKVVKFIKENWQIIVVVIIVLYLLSRMNT